MSIIIIRHKKENLKKCSLRPLELNEPGRCIFYRYPLDENVHLPNNGFVLHMSGEVLTKEVKGSLILLDATWRYAEVMYRMCSGLRGLPVYTLPSGWVSAYPRRQEDCTDPSRGLASIEALYIASLVTGRETGGLLDGYYWKEEFLEKNKKIIKEYI